jgi:hypothetical protein
VGWINWRFLSDQFCSGALDTVVCLHPHHTHLRLHVCLQRRLYADPIARAQERDATADDQKLGTERAAELARKVQSVVLRRTQAILARHLPPLR